MAIATAGHVWTSRLSFSFQKTHSPFSSNFMPFTFSPNLSHAAFSRGYLSADIFGWQKRSPVICMAKRYAPNTTKRKRLSRQRGGDPDKKRHRRRKGSKKKKLFKIIKLVSAAGTGFSYAKKKSRKMDKLVMKKYDSKVKHHVVFTETK